MLRGIQITLTRAFSLASSRYAWMEFRTWISSLSKFKFIRSQCSPTFNGIRTCRTIKSVSVWDSRTQVMRWYVSCSFQEFEIRTSGEICTIRRPTILFAICATHRLLFRWGILPRSPSSWLDSRVDRNDVVAVSTLLMCAYASITYKSCKHVIRHKLE